MGLSVSRLHPPHLLLTSDPDFAELAAQELQQARPGAALIGRLAPGLVWARTADGFEPLSAYWRAQPPIFVRHICPVQLTCPLPGHQSDLALLVDTIADELAALVDADFSFSVQSRLFGDFPYRPFALNEPLSTRISQLCGAPVDVRRPQQILSLVCVASLDGALLSHLPDAAQGIALAGLSLAVQNLSDWAGGVRRFAKEPGQISRAEFKLLEALELFAIELPAHGTALDLGAAPGGWTRILRQLQQFVTAVDPASLDPRLAHDRGVRHRRMTAEAFLADEPDLFDLVVNDIRMDARDSARLMVQVAPLLYAHGSAIMTLKLPTQNRRRVVDHALAILAEAYLIAGARQLFHNRSEITLYLRKPPPGQG